MRFPRLVSVLALVPACFSDNAPEPNTGSVTQGINGLAGVFDYAIDLPWRIEPRFRPDGSSYYDPIPINISIHDEDTAIYELVGPQTAPHLGDFCQLKVGQWIDGEMVNPSIFQWNTVKWFEKTGRAPVNPPSNQPTYWPLATSGLPNPWHGECHPFSEDCSYFRTIRDTSEWHAMAHWEPSGLRPGARITVAMEVEVSKEVGDCADLDDRITLRNFAQLHLGSEPLPRLRKPDGTIDERWLYGDLHYHAEGSDNEGESAYSYRAAVEAMAALGIDFAYATDHASDSEQIVDVDLDLTPEHARGLRDMNQARFDAGLVKMHAADGANAEVATRWPAGRPRVPRIFLGAEVDVTPEIDDRPESGGLEGDPRWMIPYGDHRFADITKYSCAGWLGASGPCPTNTWWNWEEAFTPFTDIFGVTAWMPKDTQGIDSLAVGRQHVLHLPRYPDQPQGFVPSRTSKYGGATRHLVESNGVLPEIRAKQGLAFLAHPNGWGGGTKGPGSLPYTEYQYRKIFGEEAFAGLEFWNENVRWVSEKHECDCGGFEACGCPVIGDWRISGYDWGTIDNMPDPGPGYEDGLFELIPMYDLENWYWGIDRDGKVDGELHNGAATWDQLLRWGLDLQRTQPIDWLADGEPRRLFMAGGSDAHGDFNYRREGYMEQPTQTNDTAFATVRNLVFAGDPRPPCHPDTEQGDPCPPAPPEFQSSHSQDQVAEALAEGRFSVTDGPALRIMIDRNRNGQIDDYDIPMGGIASLYNEEDLPLLIQWESTLEFGSVDKIDLYVGVDSNPDTCTGEFCPPTGTRGRTYAYWDHGVRVDSNDAYQYDDPVWPFTVDVRADACNGPVCQMGDGYWQADNATMQKLRIIPNGTIGGLRGVAQVTLDPDAFPVSDAANPTRRVSRMYVRAFARTKRGCEQNDPSAPDYLRRTGQCIPRYAFTNPVWALRETWTQGSECPLDDRALDRDLDGAPDACDAYPDDPAGASWTRRFGWASYDEANAVAFGPQGNGSIVTAGRVYNNGNIEVTSLATQNYTANMWEGIVAKYGREGVLYNKFVSNGTGGANFNDVAVDSAGNVYIVGQYWSGTMYLGNLYSYTNDTDAFVAKLDANLVPQWIQRFTGTGSANAISVVVAPDGSLAVLGNYTGAMTIGTTAQPTAASSDCFITQVASTGTLSATTRLTGTGTCNAREIVYDGQGLMFAGVDVTGQTTVGTLTRTNAAQTGLVVGYYATPTSYLPIWITWLGGTTAGWDASIGGMASDAGGSVYVGGWFKTRLNVEKHGYSSTYWTSGGGTRDGYVVKLQPGSGDADLSYQLRILGGPGDDGISDVAVKDTGELAVTGSYGSSWFWFGPTMYLNSLRDGVLLVFRANGTYVWGRDFGLTGATTPNAVAIAPDYRTAIAGGFDGTAQIDDRRRVQTTGSTDGFVSAFPAPSTLSTSAP